MVSILLALIAFCGMSRKPTTSQRHLVSIHPSQKCLHGMSRKPGSLASVSVSERWHRSVSGRGGRKPKPPKTDRWIPQNVLKAILRSRCMQNRFFFLSLYDCINLGVKWVNL